MARLGDVVTVSASTRRLDSEEIWLLNLEMVEQQTGYIISYNYVSADKLNDSIVQFDTENVLYSKLRPNLNKVVVPSQSGFATSEMLPLRPDTSILTREYLAAYLRSDSFVKWAVSKSAGAKMPRLGTKELLNKEVPVPTLEKQKYITKILEKIDTLISLRKQQLAKLDELVKARFVEMFGESRTNSMGWQIINLEKIADVGSSKRVFVEELQDTGIPFYRGTEIGALAEGKKVVPELFITAEHYQTLCEATGAPTIGDLLMPSICPDGRIWLVDTDEPFYFKDGRVLWVHPTSAEIDNCYLQYAMKEKIMADYVNIASGTTFAELKIFALKALPIMLPPLKQQLQFSAFITAIKKDALTIQQSLDKMEVLKKSLMQEYFMG